MQEEFSVDIWLPFVSLFLREKPKIFDEANLRANIDNVSLSVYSSRKLFHLWETFHDLVSDYIYSEIMCYSEIW